MQVAAAASQRAHAPPPPVPPRPSRHVVAEALKKTTMTTATTTTMTTVASTTSIRPPCPTRQAPPPPNQRPWRQGAQKVQDGGRTIIYDSALLGNRFRDQKQGEKKKIPARDPPKDQKVNGTRKELERKKIEDTSKRKEEPVPQTNGCNNNNDSSSDNRNHADAPDKRNGCGEATDTSSTDRKKSKAHSVTFQESQALPQQSSLQGSRRDDCATVVVIDEPEPGGKNLQEEHDNIQRLDWLEAGVRYSATKITLPAEQETSAAAVNGFAQQPRESLEFADLDFSSIIERIAMSSLQGLPPLPRSLSGFNLNGAGLDSAPPPPARSSSKSQRAPKTPSTTSLSSQGSRPSPQGRQLTTLDTQLAILRREMFGLRQLDLSLLSQLWSLNESIQEFRQLLQDQEDRVPSPSPSSEEGDDTSYGGSSCQPPPPPRRPAPLAPQHYHPQQQYHHHHHHSRSARSARSSKLPLSDESPSSEEYGAV